MSSKNLVCPYCGCPKTWLFGVVFHAEYVHVRLRIQAEGANYAQELASIVKRNPVERTASQRKNLTP